MRLMFFFTFETIYNITRSPVYPFTIIKGILNIDQRMLKFEVHKEIGLTI